MPASLKRDPATAGSVLLHKCEICGGDASFGVEVHFRAALNTLAAKDVIKAKRLLGLWYCGEHRPVTGR